MSDFQPRWLNPEQAAAYIGRRVDELPRLLRAGKLPQPSYHFGPRSPRYDRQALDALFTGARPSDDLDKVEADAVAAIRARAANRAPPPRRRHGEGISLRTTARAEG